MKCPECKGSGYIIEGLDRVVCELCAGMGDVNGATILNIIEGGVQALKEAHEEINQLKTDKAALIEAFEGQTDTINKLIYEQQKGA